MNDDLRAAIDAVRSGLDEVDRPLAVILAGHNGSGKSTMWRRHLANDFRIPLFNADRVMTAVLPEPSQSGALVSWAADLRDHNLDWMRVAQRGVQALIVEAMAAAVPFAFETVFSDWRPQPDGSVASKIDRIRELQAAGYVVLLFFVGLTDAALSALRVQTRIGEGGHAVPMDRLIARFARTQRAVSEAVLVADASILVDNSRAEAQAFTVCRAQIGPHVLYDVRSGPLPVPREMSAWMDRVVPMTTG